MAFPKEQARAFGGYTHARVLLTAGSCHTGPGANLEPSIERERCCPSQHARMHAPSVHVNSWHVPDADERVRHSHCSLNYAIGKVTYTEFR